MNGKIVEGAAAAAEKTISEFAQSPAVRQVIAISEKMAQDALSMVRRSPRPNAAEIEGAGFPKVDIKPFANLRPSVDIPLNSSKYHNLKSGADFTEPTLVSPVTNLGLLKSLDFESKVTERFYRTNRGLMPGPEHLEHRELRTEFDTVIGRNPDGLVGQGMSENLDHYMHDIQRQPTMISQKTSYESGRSIDVTFNFEDGATPAQLMLGKTAVNVEATKIFRGSGAGIDYFYLENKNGILPYRIASELGFNPTGVTMINGGMHQFHDVPTGGREALFKRIGLELPKPPANQYMRSGCPLGFGGRIRDC